MLHIFLGISVRCQILGRLSILAQWLRALDICVSQHLSGAGSSPAGSVGRGLNL